MWNTMSCSPFYQKFLREKEVKRHKDCISKATHTIDARPPKILSQSCFKRSSYDYKLLSVDNINKCLLKKMLSIDTKSYLLIKNDNENLLKNQELRNARRKLKIGKNIKAENRILGEKLNNSKSIYARKKLIREYNCHMKLLQIHDRSFRKLDIQSIQPHPQNSYYDRLLTSELQKQNRLNAGIIL